MEQTPPEAKSPLVRQQKVVLRRIRAIDAEIRSGSYPNSNDLAKKLEVGVRTISRDLDEMRLFYNAPIAFDRAKNGYYYTENSFYIKDISLSEGELFSVALFERLLSGYRNTPLKTHLRSVFRKIAESLGKRATIDTMYLDDSVTYISEPLAQIDAEVFNTVFSAVRQSKEITFEYRPLQKQTYMTRTVKPYHIVCQKGSWYVIGLDDYKNGIRIFAFSRIKNAAFTGNAFSIPEDFDWRTTLTRTSACGQVRKSRTKSTCAFRRKLPLSQASISGRVHKPSRRTMTARSRSPLKPRNCPKSSGGCSVRGIRLRRLNRPN